MIRAGGDRVDGPSPRCRLTGALRRLRAALPPLIVAVLAALHAPARAQPSDTAAAAEVLFREAMALIQAGKTAEACPKFAASHRLGPGFGVVYNLGSCYEALGKTASAWAAFREAAGWARKYGETARYEKAVKRAAALEPRLVNLRVVVPAPPEGLVVRRGDTVIDRALWGSTIPVDPGRYTFTATAAGKRQWTKAVPLDEPGKTVVVEIPPLDEAAAPVDTTPPPGAVPPPYAALPAGAEAGPRAADRSGPDVPGAPSRGALSTPKVLALGAGGIGVAGVSVGAVLGALAASRWGEARGGHCTEDHVCDARGAALHGEARTMAHVATAGFVVGGVGLAAAATLWLLAPSGGAPQGRRGVSSAPVAGPGGGGIVVIGRF